MCYKALKSYVFVFVFKSSCVNFKQTQLTRQTHRAFINTHVATPFTHIFSILSICCYLIPALEEGPPPQSVGRCGGGGRRRTGRSEAAGAENMEYRERGSLFLSTGWLAEVVKSCETPRDGAPVTCSLISERGGYWSRHSFCE